MRSTVLAVIAAAGLAQGAAADVLNIPVIIRDFNASHPDMEELIASDPGIVMPTLGGDGKPVYAGQAGNPTTSGAANFDQWYRDVEGVNMRKNTSIALDNGSEAEGGVYSICDEDFFPIDDELLGNEGRNHNYHFTLELHAQFTYTPGLFFSFTGDDDLWVFINDELVIDLGGVHAAESASVDLDTLGLVEGQTYDFDLFFAERHTTQSVFCIETSIVLVPAPATAGVLALGLPALSRRRRRA